MDELRDFLTGTYKLSSDIVITKHAVDSYFLNTSSNTRYVLLCTPSVVEIAAVLSYISYLNNRKVINQILLKTQSGSDYVEFSGKYCAIWKVNQLSPIDKFTKQKIKSVLSKLSTIDEEGRYIGELFEANDSYQLSRISDKVLKQLDKASDYFEDFESIGITDFDSAEFNKENIQTLKDRLRECVDRLTDDIYRNSVNINTENSFFQIGNDVEVNITDKIFLGHPVFQFAQLTALMIANDNEVSEEEIRDLVKEEYEGDIDNHFTGDYFDDLVNIYLFSVLYKEHRKDEESDSIRKQRIAKALYRSGIVSWQS
jgi:hypothetical protein